MMQFGNRIIFPVGNYRDWKLWITDGTDVGPIELKSGVVNEGSSLGVFGDRLFFQGRDVVTGLNLWVTDGTSEGTMIFKEIKLGYCDSNPITYYYYGSYSSCFYELGDGKIVFRANDGTNGMELWITDGTQNGTMLLKDINPGSDSSSPLRPAVQHNGKIFFGATDGTHGRELWVTDGTSSGTVLVKDIFLGIESSGPAWLASVRGKIMFWADDGIHGNKIWKSDGTANGTVLLKENEALVGPNPFTEFCDELFFFAKSDGFPSRAWSTDGTTLGTKLVGNYIRKGYGCFTPVGDKLVFTSTSGLVMISSAEEGATILSVEAWELCDQVTVVKEKAFFFTQKTVYPDWDLARRYPEQIFTLWVVDVVIQKTVPVAQMSLGECWSEDWPQSFHLGGKFISMITKLCDEFYYASGGRIYELWTSDGTVEGTVHISTYNGENDKCLSSGCVVRGFTKLDENVALFVGFDTDGNKGLWKIRNTQTVSMSNKNHYWGSTYGDNNSTIPSNNMTNTTKHDSSEPLNDGAHGHALPLTGKHWFVLVLTALLSSYFLPPSFDPVFKEIC